MILVDTSIWIEFFKANPTIFPIIERELEHQNILAAECVFAELMQGTKNKREINIIEQFWLNLPKKEEAGLWIKAGLFSSQNKLFSKGIGLIDAFLIIYARKNSAKLWTLDKKIKSILKSSEIYR